jgi:hypothetical protein
MIPTAVNPEGRQVLFNSTKKYPPAFLYYILVLQVAILYRYLEALLDGDLST